MHTYPQCTHPPNVGNKSRNVDTCIGFSAKLFLPTNDLRHAELQSKHLQLRIRNNKITRCKSCLLCSVIAHQDCSRHPERAPSGSPLALPICLTGFILRLEEWPAVSPNFKLRVSSQSECQSIVLYNVSAETVLVSGDVSATAEPMLLQRYLAQLRP